MPRSSRSSGVGDQARGATLYVTLEPCCHDGKTPPCTSAILAAGIVRVVAAMRDPFPEVNGRGLALLESAGLTVETGCQEQPARCLNAAYLKRVTTGLPYVTAKWAMTLDGKTAVKTGDSRWISSESSRKQVHQLRGRMEAIVAGIGTVLADDPLLTARPPGPRWRPAWSSIAMPNCRSRPASCRQPQSAPCWSRSRTRPTRVSVPSFESTAVRSSPFQIPQPSPSLTCSKSSQGAG